LTVAKLRAKGILLDFDGTIVDSREAYFAAARAAFRALGLGQPGEKVSLEIPRSLERKKPLSEVVEVDRERFLGVYLGTYYSVTAEKTHLLPNVSTALKALCEKAKLGLITMRCVPKEDIVGELRRFKVWRYFSCVIAASDACESKPSPEALLKCAEALGLPIGDCVMVGDSVSDMRAGKAAGAKTVAVLSGLFSREELAGEKPDLILKDVGLLPDFIE
jgi:phosphoglycolate phosphatase